MSIQEQLDDQSQKNIEAIRASFQDETPKAFEVAERVEPAGREVSEKEFVSNPSLLERIGGSIAARRDKVSEFAHTHYDNTVGTMPTFDIREKTTKVAKFTRDWREKAKLDRDKYQNVHYDYNNDPKWLNDEGFLKPLKKSEARHLRAWNVLNIPSNIKADAADAFDYRREGLDAFLSGKIEIIKEEVQYFREDFKEDIKDRISYKRKAAARRVQKAHEAFREELEYQKENLTDTEDNGSLVTFGKERIVAALSWSASVRDKMTEGAIGVTSHIAVKINERDSVRGFDVEERTKQAAVWGMVFGVVAVAAASRFGLEFGHFGGSGLHEVAMKQLNHGSGAGGGSGNGLNTLIEKAANAVTKGVNEAHTQRHATGGQQFDYFRHHGGPTIFDNGKGSGQTVVNHHQVVAPQTEIRGAAHPAEYITFHEGENPSLRMAELLHHGASSHEIDQATDAFRALNGHMTEQQAHFIPVGSHMAVPIDVIEKLNKAAAKS